MPIGCVTDGKGAFLGDEAGSAEGNRPNVEPHQATASSEPRRVATPLVVGFGAPLRDAAQERHGSRERR